MSLDENIRLEYLDHNNYFGRIFFHMMLDITPTP